MPDDHAVGAGLEQRPCVLEAADAPGGLHGQPGRGHGAHELGPHPAGTGAVQIDEVDSPGAGSRPAPGERRGITRSLDDRVVVPLVEPHRFLAEHVDGRDHLDRPVEPLESYPITVMLAC